MLADFAAISRWAPNVDHSCLLSEQAAGVGAVRRIQTDGSTIIETIQGWQPGLMLSYGITGLPPVIKSLTNTWHLAAEGEKTRVTLITDVDAGPRPPQLLIAKAVGKRLASVSDQMLHGLTRHLEAMTPRTTTTGATS